VGGIALVFLGSRGSKMLRHSPVPVLVLVLVLVLPG
jgi:nucleotide-binding universal stress UspA family protein